MMDDEKSPSSKPGEGWSNSAIPPQMYPVTQNGRITLYSTQRRLIHTSTTWSRTAHSDPNDPVAKSSSASSNDNDNSKSTIGCQEEEAKTIKSLMSQLSESFYSKGWQVGTGGGISMRMGNGTPSNPYRVFSTPSGIQKEDMVGDVSWLQYRNETLSQYS